MRVTIWYYVGLVGFAALLMVVALLAGVRIWEAVLFTLLIVGSIHWTESKHWRTEPFARDERYLHIRGSAATYAFVIENIFLLLVFLLFVLHPSSWLPVSLGAPGAMLLIAGLGLAALFLATFILERLGS